MTKHHDYPVVAVHNELYGHYRRDIYDCRLCAAVDDTCLVHQEITAVVREIEKDVQAVFARD